MKKILILFAFVFIIKEYSFSQQYIFKQFGVEKGVEQSDILCIAQADNNYLLYGTNGGGLGIFDGLNFKSVKIKNGLSDNVVFSITKYLDNKIWVFTNSGISKYNIQTNKVEKIICKHTAFYESYFDGNHFYTSDAKHLYIIKNDTIEPVKAEGLPSEYFVTDITKDYNGTVWIATKNHGAYKITNNRAENLTTEDGLLSNYVTDIYVNPLDSILYFGTFLGLNYLSENNTIEKINLFQNKWDLPVTDITAFNNKLILASLNGIFIYDLKTQKIKWINTNNGLPSSKIWKLFVDNENNLWIATIGKGLLQFQPMFIYYSKNDGLMEENIYSLYNKEDKVFAGAKSFGFYEINLNTDSLKIINNESATIYSIVDYKNQIWLGTNKGLSYIDKKSRYIITPYSIKDAYYLEVIDNILYIASYSGIYKFKNDTLKIDKRFPEQPYYCIKKSGNKIWATSDGEIFTYDKHTLKTYKKGDQIKNTLLNFNRARTITADNQERIWIATDNGIYVFHKDSLFLINEDNGLSSNNIYLLQKDNNGSIWAGSNKGLDHINFTKHLTQLIIENYSYEEGFKGVETNLNASTIDKNNNLWFGTVGGVFKLNPNYKNLNTLPQLTIKSIEVDDQPVTFIIHNNQLTNEISFDYNHKTFQINYIGVYLSNPKKVNYKYRILGLSDNWSAPITDNKLLFNKIPFGKYRIQIKASVNNLEWTQPVEISLNINPPFWRTYWFYVLSVISVIALFYGFLKFRISRLEKNKKELELLVNERTAELRKEKERVEQQHEIIKIANKNITDSIDYAKKIQTSLLPNKESLPKEFDDVEVLFMPKDIVSGDFYWFDKVDDKVVLCASDCTGHGVPGAFMSMLGINNLNQIILEKKITEPSKILKELNNSIKKALKQNDFSSSNKDGMDIAICTICTKTLMSEYAGAFRPLVLVSNGEIIEYKPNRKSIGGYTAFNEEFESSKLQLQKNDVVYMFSDGYQDQFGGPKGKKFMVKKLNKLFVEIAALPLTEQVKTLKSTFEKWKGNEEQVDDVLILIAKI
ncbi:MAG: hypothetical protein Kow0079_03290 [Vicingaceae bacterium]